MDRKAKEKIFIINSIVRLFEIVKFTKKASTLAFYPHEEVFCFFRSLMGCVWVSEQFVLFGRHETISSSVNHIKNGKNDGLKTVMNILSGV
jgi:hypothetical protein